MSLFPVVQRLLDKAGTAFIEPRREDGHGSSALTPTFVDTGITQPTTPADTQPVSGTVALDATTLAALETVQVGNLPSEYPLPAAQVAALTPQTNALTNDQLRAAPIEVIDDYATTQSAADQTGADNVLTFNFTSPADFVMVDVDVTTPTDYATYRARALLDGSNPSASTGFVCRSGTTTYLPFPTSGVVKVFAPTGTVVAVQVGRRG